MDWSALAVSQEVIAIIVVVLLGLGLQHGEKLGERGREKREAVGWL